MRRFHAWAWVAAGCLLLNVALGADTLVMHDGQRVDGQLVSVRDGVVEFEARRGFFGRERLRVDQGDVARIEFDDPDTRRGVSSGGSDSQRPSGMRERSVVITATEPWTDTGITVRPGQTVYFEATGRVRWGPGRQDGPGGERSSPRNEARPIPSRPAAAIIGRIGEGNEYFFIGDEVGPIRLRGGGKLYLGINDDILQDNSGSFRVTVFY